MNWRWVSIAALLGTVVMGYRIFIERESLDIDADEAPPRPGYYLSGAVVTETQLDGTPGLRLIAQRVEQQPQDDSFVLEDVRVDYLKLPEQTWTLSAQRGLVPADSPVVYLSGDVNLYPRDAQAAAEPSLHTEALAIDTEKSIAYTTSSPVTVRFGGHVLIVKSLEADLAGGKVRLESGHGRLHPG